MMSNINSTTSTTEWRLKKSLANMLLITESGIDT